MSRCGVAVQLGFFFPALGCTACLFMVLNLKRQSLHELACMGVDPYITRRDMYMCMYDNIKQRVLCVWYRMSSMLVSAPDSFGHSHKKKRHLRAVD
jgi:hypothetical protein